MTGAPSRAAGLHEFCTLFDVNYLPRGLALHTSLAAVGAAFRLRVVCMDDVTAGILEELDLPGLEPVRLGELERHDAELLAVKPTRSAVEYCWTATPAICAFFLDREPEIDAITYLDADLMFFADPAPIFEELGGDSVLITPHRYAPRWEFLLEESGIYNVQFVTFRRASEGLAALAWWRERCLEWCHAWPEDGKLGDQKYLDDWPERFTGVHVLEHPGGGLAPWNVERHELSCVDGTVRVDGHPLIFYHHQSLRLYDRPLGARRLPEPYRSARTRPRLAWTSSYPVAPLERRLVWDPYLERLAAGVASARAVRPDCPAGVGVLPLADVARRTIRAGSRWLRPAARAARTAVEQIPGVGLRIYRGSWRSAQVSRAMAALAADDLRASEPVAPYGAFAAAIERIVAEPDLPCPATLLDVGCGVGHYSEILERVQPGRFVYTGCDYAPAMIAEAQRTWPGRTFLVGDVLSSQLDLSGYDVILASGLVDVLADYREALGVLLGSSARYILLHRQRVAEGLSHVEIVRGYGRQRTYRSFLTADDLRAVAARYGREIVDSVHVEGEVYSFIFGWS